MRQTPKAALNRFGQAWLTEVHKRLMLSYRTAAVKYGTVLIGPVPTVGKIGYSIQGSFGEGPEYFATGLRYPAQLLTRGKFVITSRRRLRLWPSVTLQPALAHKALQPY